MKHKQFFKFEIFYLEFRLAKCEGYVSISYHMLKKKKKLKQNFNNIQNVFYLNLSFHGDTEEGDEVHHEDRPEHGNIEELEEGAGEGDSCCLGCGVPELELWKSADEGSELLVAGCWKSWTILLRLVLRHGRVDLGGEESKQQVEMIDCQSICHDVPTL